MLGDIAQDVGKRAEAKRAVSRNGNVMLATLPGRQPHMAAALPGNLVTKPPQRPGQVVPAQIAGQLHAGMTSSRTK